MDTLLQYAQLPHAGAGIFQGIPLLSGLFAVTGLGWELASPPELFLVSSVSLETPRLC